MWKKLDYQGYVIAWDIGSLKPAIHATAKFFFFLNFIVLCEIFKDVLGRRKVKKNNMLNMINTVTNLFAAHDF